MLKKTCIQIYFHTKIWNKIAYWWYLILRPYIIYIFRMPVAIWSKVFWIMGITLSLFCQMPMKQNKAAHVIGRISSLRFNIIWHQHWRNDFNFRTAFNLNNPFYQNEFWKSARCCEMLRVCLNFIYFVYFWQKITHRIFFAVMGESNIRFGSKIQEKT